MDRFLSLLRDNARWLAGGLTRAEVARDPVFYL